MTNSARTPDPARQQDIVVFAVYLLGGAKRAIDTEDVAVKCHELAPGAFAWRKYADQINLELVRVVLSNAKKPANGRLLSGSGREGWRLSPRGIDWIAVNGDQFSEQNCLLKATRSTAGSVDTVRKIRERERIVSSAAWASWISGNPISGRDARKLFRIDEYSTHKMLEIKIVRLRSAFKDDQKLSAFIREAASLVSDEKESK